MYVFLLVSIMSNLKDSQKKAATLMGFTQKSMGKTQARREFFPLVDSLSTTSSIVEISDHNKPVAVLLSYENYAALTAKLCMLANAANQHPMPNLMGSIKIVTDDLDEASKRISEKFEKSVKQSVKKL